MGEYVNKRIEKAFNELYKARNQFIFTGGVDDLFLINGQLHTIEEALVEFGKNKKYDLIITVKEDLTLSFAEPGQEELFNSITRGTSLHKVPKGKKVLNLSPRPAKKEEKAEAPKMDETVHQAEEAGKKNVDINTLELITRALKTTSVKVFVIFPYPEKMFLLSVDASVLQKMESIAKNWRNITQTANEASRSVLIINPYQLEAFHNLEHRVSCFDHNCEIVQIGPPDREEMKMWLKQYDLRNRISGDDRDMDRVVLTGKTKPNTNLQNFAGWVQGFFNNKGQSREWKDLLKAENEDAVESKEDLLQQLDEMIGLSQVKEEIRTIVKHAEEGKNPEDANYHMFFLGNPGTGKTVVAEIIARLFWAMELRTSRKTVSITLHDIIGEYNEGEAINRMKNKIDEAMGGVLFVDEAYLFAESEWGKKAFQVLLTEMENHRKELTVIFAGYENRLQALKDINEGIDSRVPTRLHFHDYSPEEKLDIFKLFLKKYNQKNGDSTVTLAPSAEMKLMRILDRSGGNGRGVRTVWDRVIARVENDKVREILPEHIIDPHEINKDEVDNILKEIDQTFFGMWELKQQLRDFFKKVQLEADRNEMLALTKDAVNRPCYRLRFTGPPGTGKTSIARYMGRFFHAMGICETDDCRECGATTLKGAYIGKAQETVNNLFHENQEKVIFIDEIYSLYNPSAGQDDSYGREAIDTLVRCLTAEEYRDTVVIVAGYKKEVDQFMDANPGLASRIPLEIRFPNYTPDECVEIFKRTAEKRAYRLKDEDGEVILNKLFAHLLEKDGDKFGNARTVNGVLDSVIDNLADRISKKEKEDRTEDDYRDILKEDIESLLPKQDETTGRIPADKEQL